MLFDLSLEERPFLLDDEDLLEPVGEGGEPRLIQRPDEPDLVDAETQSSRRGGVDAE